MSPADLAFCVFIAAGQFGTIPIVPEGYMTNVYEGIAGNAGLGKPPPGAQLIMRNHPGASVGHIDGPVWICQEKIP